MARIRHILIENFRGIKRFEWFPSPGINCLVGAGDSGKSTVLDAVDCCLGARRSIPFNDADFFEMDVSKPITIVVTLGELDDSLKTLDSYGLFVRGFDSKHKKLEEEPDHDLETVLTVELRVTNSLEAEWSLVSERAKTQDLRRDLSWGDRAKIAPTRIGTMADHHLGWGRGSVLNRLSEERADASTALAQAARDVRKTFGDQAEKQLEKALKIVEETASELGISTGDLKAMLDVHSASLTGNTVCLHDDAGVPLRKLGIGSARLLVAGLQRKASKESAILIADELEHGLEPHRIIRLIDSLGAKESKPPLQVFMATHSPVVLRELSGDQIALLKPLAGKHEVRVPGCSDEIQGTLRLYPEAFLAPSILVCEGASEVGLIRGIDQFRVVKGRQSLSALGGCLVDCGGGRPESPFTRAAAFEALGYRTAILRDNDKQADPKTEKQYQSAGGAVFEWRKTLCLEDELFQGLPKEAIQKLFELAIQIHGEALVDAHIRSASSGSSNGKTVEKELAASTQLATSTRKLLGLASRTKSASWFKNVRRMEFIGRHIVAPSLEKSDKDFASVINKVFAWIEK
ncbi:MAG: AAA family ATPase [Acidobacteria bacterium]|nr:AAA family ATPase [Acidobacteriota bacterium]MBS1867815.1 AAA family ATPase [Acidobacteriota bacterium]